MERTIKFRGKRKDNGEWVYGYYTVTENRHYISTGEMGHFPVTASHHLMYEALIRIEVIPETVGQFTGLHDRNGKEIYEGDIVEMEIRGLGIGRVKIVWQEGGFSIYEKHNGYLATQEAAKDESIILHKVVGNIHDNPELLTDKK